MKIHELAKISHVNSETIRMYRKQGFLHPDKLDNGYYEYTTEDFASLIHLRKMRAYSMSLDDIQQQQSLERNDDIIAIFNNRAESMDEEIRKMKKKIRILELEKEHLRNSLQTDMKHVSVIQSADRKIDLYGKDMEQFMVFRDYQSDVYLTSTIALRISKDILNGEIVDQEIPLEVGIGTYEFYLNAGQTIPQTANITPNGKFICQTLTLSNLSTINILALAPMMEYAKKIGQPFISDTTAYLASIHNKDNTPQFTFRIRACIEENEIVTSASRMKES